MKNIFEYDSYSDDELCDLIGDLRDLGIGGDRVYFQIYKKFSSINNKEIVPFSKITLTNCNRIRGKISLEHLIKNLFDKNDYKIELDSEYIQKNKISRVPNIIRNLMYYIDMSLVTLDSNDIKFPHLFMESFKREYNFDRIDLVIDDKIINSV